MTALPPIGPTLLRLGAAPDCDDLTWAAAYGSDWERAWAECDEPAGMLWLLERSGVDARWLAMCACWIAVPALAYVPAGERRPHDAVRAAVRYLRGEATRAELDAASQAARDAAWAASDAASDVAWAARQRASCESIRAVVPWHMLERALLETMRGVR
jgi:hypothetical protein